MRGWCFFSYLLGWMIGIVNSIVDLDSAIRLAHCRATCMFKMDFTNLRDQDCTMSYNCSQCWDVCRLLQKSRSVCYQPDCSGGCQASCQWTSSGPLSPVQFPPPLEELSVVNHMASWSPPPSTSPRAVYLVMVDHHQYLQTLDLTASLPLGVDPLTVQVLVVDWRGLTEVFTPRPQSPLEVARTLVCQLGLERTMGLIQQHTNQTVTISSSVEDSETKPWALKEVSRYYLRDMVRVQLSWSPQHNTLLTYLVTWQCEPGVLTTNLLTHSNNVTLSLDPDDVYQLQVTLFTLDRPSRSSEILVIDARRRLSDNRFYPLHPWAGKVTNILWGFMVVVAMTAVVAYCLIMGWRYQLRHYQPKLTAGLVTVDWPRLREGFSPKIYQSPKSTHEGNISSREHLLKLITTNQLNEK